MIPAPALVIAATSTQVGGAFAKTLFGHLGPGGTTLLRVAFAAAILLAVWRPRLAGDTCRDLALAAAFELEALRRIPKRVFGILMSLDLAMAAVAGLVVLGEGLSAREVVAVGLVVAAGAGAAAAGRPAPDRPLDA